MKSNEYENELLMAKKIAKTAHKGQFDKAGVAYFEHVKAVGEAGETIEEKIVGYLHDVVENSDITLVDLAAHGFSRNTLTAVDAITRRQDESSRKYNQRVESNPIAAKVKLNALKCDSELDRIDSPSKKDLSQKEKYKNAVDDMLRDQLFAHLKKLDKFPPMRFKLGQKVRIKDKENLTGIIYAADFGGAMGFDVHTYDVKIKDVLHKHIPEAQLEEVEQEESQL